MLAVQREFPVPSAARFTGMAYDGLSYYLVNGQERKVYRYGQDFKPEASLDADRVYAGLCFDPERGGFWAADRRQPALYRLDASLREIDCLPVVLTGYGGDPGPVQSVSCAGGRLLAVFGSCLVGLDPCSCESPALLTKTEDMLLQCALAVGPQIVLLGMGEGGQTLRLLSADGQTLHESLLPRDCDTVTAAVCRSASDTEEQGRLQLLVSRRCRYAYVWDCLLTGDEEEPAAYSPMPPPCAVRPLQTQAEKEPVCGEEPVDPSRILEAVALSERAVSCVLNAQGDQLREVLSSSGDPAEILAADRKTQAALRRATRLEYALYDLLSILEDPAGAQVPSHKP
ncbi:MAG: hypothetical protein HFE86_07085 [Clostridiales bacterium]|nr:hypothetical protein [Clostridiales bacterium]